MGRQIGDGANWVDGTARDRAGRSPASTVVVLADVVPLIRKRRRMATTLARVWIRLRQEAASGELSPRSPTPTPPSHGYFTHPSRAGRRTGTGLSHTKTVGPPRDAA